MLKISRRLTAPFGVVEGRNHHYYMFCPRANPTELPNSRRLQRLQMIKSFVVLVVLNEFLP